MFGLNALNIKDPRFQKIAGTIVLFSVILFIWHSRSYSANKKIISQKQAEYETLERELKAAIQTAAQLKEITKEIERLFAQYKIVQELLPSERNDADFINKLYIVARQAKIEVKSLEPQPSQQQQFFWQDPYTLEVEGTYHSIGTFFAFLANLPFSALITELKLNASGAQDPTKSSIKSRFNIIGHHLEQTEKITRTDELLKKGIKKQEGKPTGNIEPRPREPS